MHIRPVEPDHQQLRAEKARESDINCKIGDQVRIQAATPSKAYGDPKSGQEAQSDQNAVGGNVELTEFDEFRKQISE